MSDEVIGLILLGMACVGVLLSAVEEYASGRHVRSARDTSEGVSE